ncbi:MAG: hypothetical protein WBC38_03395 [Microgenomates group bacterium]
MSKQFYKDAFGWGSVLWLIGYILGILLFFVVSPSMIGWILTPIGTVITLWVLFKKIKSTSVQYYVMLAVVWTILAIVLDYFLLVKVFNPADGYYKPDVYLYYILIFILPVVVGIKKNFKTENRRR